MLMATDIVLKEQSSEYKIKYDDNIYTKLPLWIRKSFAQVCKILPKNKYTSFIKLNKLEFYINTRTRQVDVKGLGQAIEQTARNNANNKIADTQNERSRAINDIYTLINQATYNYGIDSDTLLKNFNADKLKYMSTAEIQALEKKLQVDMYNTDWTNKFL